MLTSLSLSNFKCWREISSLPMGPITAVFGPNSAGKSSILQLPLLLKQTADSPDRAQPLNLGDEKSLVSLGTFPEVIFRHSTRDQLSWKLTWDLDRPLHISDPEHPQERLFSDIRMGLRATIGGNGSGRVVVHRLAYEFDGHEFGMVRADDGGYRMLAGPGPFQFSRVEGRPWSLPAPDKCYGFPDQVRAYHLNAGFLSDFQLAFEELLARVFYLGPLREHPRREYSWAGAEPVDVGQRGERVVDALLASRARGERVPQSRGGRNLTVEECVAWWLRELRLITSFSVEEITPGGNLYRVWVQKDDCGPRVLLTDAGFGVSQLLPVLTLCYSAPEGSTLIVEQPEIHLHPSVQAGLADVFIEVAQTRRIQIVLESHSEHLLLRLQRRVAEERLAPESAALYFCRHEAGEAHLRPLELDRFGQIRNWPEDFFGNSFEEVAETARVGIRRRREAA